jgi:hypothetical protein
MTAEAIIACCERVTARCDRGRVLRGERSKIAGSLLAAGGVVHCRIQVRRENDRVIVRLAGRLAGREVPELLAACIADEPPILELDELVSADAIGLDALLRLEAGGAQLIELPEYIRLKLNVLARERRR